MTRLAARLKRAQALSVAAKEEYQRAGHPAIDVEHLLLALLVVGGASGRALAEQGVTLASAREAGERVHADLLRSLGIELTTSAATDLAPDPLLADTRWSARALVVMREDALAHDDRGLLLALLDEPSGHVREILGLLDVDESALRASLARGPQAEAASQSPAGAGAGAVAGTGTATAAEDAGLGDVDRAARAGESLSATADPAAGESWQDVTWTGHVPAAPEAVWALVSDPSRRLEWEGAFSEAVTVAEDGAVVTTTRERRADGKGRAVAPGLRRTRHTLVAIEPGVRLTWELDWPDADQPRRPERRRRRQTVRLRPDGAGTELTLAQSRLRVPGLVRRLLTPAYRFVTWQGLFARAGAISRVLR